MATIKTAMIGLGNIAEGTSMTEVTALLPRIAVAAGNSEMTASLARTALAAGNSEVTALLARLAVAARNSEVTASLVRTAVAAVNSEVTASLATTAVAAAEVLPIFGYLALAVSLATFVGGVAYVVYRTAKGYHKLIDSTAVLDLAITEVLQWQYSTAHEDNNTERVSKEKRLQLLGKYENLTRSSKCCVLQRCLGGGISMLV